MPESLCLAGICMSTSEWILLGLGVIFLSVGAVATLAKGLDFIGSAFQGLGKAVEHFFMGVACLLACGVLLWLLYLLLTKTLPPGTLPW